MAMAMNRIRFQPSLFCLRSKVMLTGTFHAFAANSTSLLGGSISVRRP